MSRNDELTVAGMAHDLSNVFETLAEASELLNGDPKWTKLAGTIRRSVRRGERILNSLTETLSDTVDLCETLDNALQQTEDVLLFTRGGSIVCERDGVDCVKLPGSAAAWERVFVNLFLNAAQANPSGARLHVSAGSANGETTIRVSDDGPGIPATILGRIFEPDVTTKKSRWRSGMGLHVVHTMVTECGGAVTAENGEETGAVFIITLPGAGFE